MPKKKQPPQTIAEKVETWLKARQIIAREKRVKKSLEPALKKMLKDAPGKAREFGITTLTLSEFDRSYFDKKAAAVELGQETIDRFTKQKPVSKILVS